MTPEQWSFLNAKLSALETLAFAIAKSLPNQQALRAVFAEQSEQAEGAFLATAQTDEHLQAVARRIDAIHIALWGQSLQRPDT
jgi:hypothetical protein